MIFTDIILSVMCPDGQTRENERYMNGNVLTATLKNYISLTKEIFCS
jgi:hypothetical protein